MRNSTILLVASAATGAVARPHTTTATNIEATIASIAAASDTHPLSHTECITKLNAIKVRLRFSPLARPSLPFTMLSTYSTQHCLIRKCPLTWPSGRTWPRWREKAIFHPSLLGRQGAVISPVCLCKRASRWKRLEGRWWPLSLRVRGGGMDI
jgi:hypothetical protein